MPAAEITALKAHVAIKVRSVNNSLEFYRKLFGIEPSKVRTGYAKFDVQNPPLNFTLNESPVGEPGALSHLGIQLKSTEDVLAMRQAWAERRSGALAVGHSLLVSRQSIGRSIAGLLPRQNRPRP